ncbi:MAG: DUF6894 family protein [Allosphingosinicella sp.]
MPRYFIHLDRPGAPLKDEIGVTLPDSEAAWYQAVRNARERIDDGDEPPEAWEAGMVEIVDEGGLPVDRIPMIEIVRFGSAGH